MGNTFYPSVDESDPGLVVLDGGTITTKSFIFGASDGTFLHKDGVLTVDSGTFSYQLNDLFMVEGSDSTKTATIVLNALANAPTFLEINAGYSSDQRGALTLSGGTHVVATQRAFIGSGAGSNGELVVAGAGSTLLVNQLYIGGHIAASSGTRARYGNHSPPQAGPEFVALNHSGNGSSAHRGANLIFEHGPRTPGDFSDVWNRRQPRTTRLL